MVTLAGEVLWSLGSWWRFSTNKSSLLKSIPSFEHDARRGGNALAPMTVLFGEEAAAAAAVVQREADQSIAAAAVHPVLLVGAAGLSQTLCGVPLWPNAELANGLPSWSTKDDSLHLYYHSSDAGGGKWWVSHTFTPDEDASCAQIAVPGGGRPPSGEAQWQVDEDEVVSAAHRANDSGWAKVPMTVLFGEQAYRGLAHLHAATLAHGDMAVSHPSVSVKQLTARLKLLQTQQRMLLAALLHERLENGTAFHQVAGLDEQEVHPIIHLALERRHANLRYQEVDAAVIVRSSNPGSVGFTWELQLSRVAEYNCVAKLLRSGGLVSLSIEAFRSQKREALLRKRVEVLEIALQATVETAATKQAAVEARLLRIEAALGSAHIDD